MEWVVGNIAFIADEIVIALVITRLNLATYRQRPHCSEQVHSRIASTYPSYLSISILRFDKLLEPSAGFKTPPENCKLDINDRYMYMLKFESLCNNNKKKIKS